MSSIERWRLRNGRSANERVQAKPGRVALASGWMRFVIPPNGRISELSNRTARARAAHAGKDWEVPEGISRAAEKAREYASNVGKTLSETARSTASAAGEYAEQARQTTMDQSGRMVEQTQSIVREQPLLVAMAGLVAGAAVAAAFPTTRMERETLGPAGKRLSEAATNAGERLSEAASAAGERLMAVAEERGVDADGLKEAARDVAGTFERSVTGARTDDRTSGNKEMPSSGGASSQYGTASVRPGSADDTGQSSNSGFGVGSPTPGRPIR